MLAALNPPSRQRRLSAWGGQRIYSGGGAGRSRYKRDDELTWMIGGGR
jgi:hypothetical protein